MNNFFDKGNAHTRFFRRSVLSIAFAASLVFVASYIFRVDAMNSAIIPDPAAELPRADDPSGAQTGVPDYVLETLKGKDLRLSSLRGKIVLLDFFNATCPHCQKHAPVISALAKKYRQRNFVVVNLCAHNPYLDREIVETYVKNAGIENDVVWSPYELFTRYLEQSPEGFYGVPQMVLFDANGRVAARFAGWDEKNPPQVEQAVLKILK